MRPVLYTVWRGDRPWRLKPRLVELYVINTAFPTYTESFGLFLGEVNGPCYKIDPTDSLRSADMIHIMKVCRRIDDSGELGSVQWVL